MKKNKTKEKTIEDVAKKFQQDAFSGQMNSPEVVNNKDEQPVNKGEIDLEIGSKERGAREVHEKVMSAMQRNASKMRNMKPIDFSTIPDEFYDEEGEKVDLNDLTPEIPDKPESTKLPANISKELRAEGVNEIKWTNTKDLPRGQDRDIRALANAVFSSFGIDEKADVVCINSFKDNDFLNKPKEVNAVAGYLDKFAASPHEGTMTQDFGKTIEGYTPEIKLYHTPSTAYLCVSEPEGQGLEGRYIYAFKRKQEFKIKNDQTESIENKETNNKRRPKNF